MPVGRNIREIFGALEDPDLDIRYHFIRSEVTSGFVNLQAIGAKENVADILTKALPKATFEGHRLGMGVSIV